MQQTASLDGYTEWFVWNNGFSYLYVRAVQLCYRVRKRYTRCNERGEAADSSLFLSGETERKSDSLEFWNQTEFRSSQVSSR
uniref:Uncharacterized protein n=1 Tax=Faecalibaculum rodentium TaxID=1702221 RepID=A0A140DYU5_9FIRM|nr:hypothetical protein AALO17_26880 [Faecalibaculum rodentium]